MCTASGIGWNAKFAETDIAILHQFIRDHPLGALTTHLPNGKLRMPDGRKIPNLQATYIPFVFDTPSGEDEEALGTLRGHIARENPHAKSLVHALVSRNSPCPFLKEEVMVLFASPAESYVTLSAVQVYGNIRLCSDISTPEKAEETSEFLLKQTTDLARHCEESLMNLEPDKSRAINEVPKSFIAKQSELIMGIEIKITRIEGMSKMGQESFPLDQMGCIRGFEAIGTSTSKEIASSIEKSMSRDTAKNRANVLKEGITKDLKLGGESLIPYGWFFPAVESKIEEMSKGNHSFPVFECFLAGAVIVGIIWVSFI